MKTRKYEFTGETKTIQGTDGPVTLQRIRALDTFGDIQKGELGGWIESERNLSQEGEAFVYEQSKVYGNARVEGNAEVRGNAEISGNAEVYGNANVYDDARVYGDARVSDRAWIQDNAQISGRAHIDGQAVVRGEAKVHDNAQVYEKARIYDNAVISGSALVYGEAEIYGSALVYGNARVGEVCVVHDFAKISGNANVIGAVSVYGNARITDNALVHGESHVCDNARIGENAVISGEATVKNSARVFGNAIVTRNAIVQDDSYVYENARISDNAQVYGTAKVHGFARIEENATVYGNARVHGPAHVTDNAQIHGYADISGDVTVNADKEVFMEDKSPAPVQESSLQGWHWKSYADSASLCMPDGTTFVSMDYATKEVAYYNYNKLTDGRPFREDWELPCGVNASVGEIRETIINDFRESSLRYLPAEMRPQLSDEPLIKQFTDVPQYDMETPESREERIREERMQIRQELRGNGFRATNSLVANMEHLNELTGKSNTLMDVKELAKDAEISAEAKEVVSEIVDNLQQQEMQMQAPEPPAVEPA